MNTVRDSKHSSKHVFNSRVPEVDSESYPKMVITSLFPFVFIFSFVDLVYVVGGNDGRSILNRVEMYDFALNQIRECPGMIEKRDELAIT